MEKGEFMKLVKVFAGVAVAVAVVGFGVIYSGIVDVGATNPHSKITEQVLHSAMQRSVAFHARDIQAPPLDKPETVMMGFRHYREMCVGCHLAPGMEESEIRQGLMPQPPKLQEAARHWTPAELFWIIKNGVKMTGMPAWGVTHSDEKIWSMVAFLQQLPDMTAAKYHEMDHQAGSGDGDEDHEH